MTIPDVGDAYDRAADAWKRGPESVYARLADAMLSTAPVELRGARVLDVGAGTAVAARAALGRGAAVVVASDIATGMLRHRGPGVLAVAADAARLPFAEASFDLATAGFCLGHLPDPGRAVTEIHRVSAAVVASAFPGEWSHPAKATIDRVMVEEGFRMPQWYEHLKEQTEPAVADADALRSLGRAAGFSSVEVERIEVDSGLDSPEAIVDWRWGMAHLAAFVASLTDGQRVRARARAEEAVAGMAPVVIPMLVLSAS
jgi:ubiquinone/menaquinone biosynthesis C-methylase UbiE